MDGMLGLHKEILAQPTQPVNLEEIHRAGGFIVLQPHVDKFPKGISEKGFEGLPPMSDKHPSFIKALADACRNYYGGYILQDPFGDDEEKRLGWQTAMLKEFPVKDDGGEGYDAFQKRIKLRLATIQGVQGLFAGLVKNLDERNIRTPEAEHARALARRMPVIVNVAPQTEFTGIGDDLAARLREALDKIPLSDADRQERERLEETSWKMMDFEKKERFAHDMDSINEEFLTMVTVAAQEKSVAEKNVA